MADGIHGGLALSALAEVVSANDRVVLGADDGHPVCAMARPAYRSAPRYAVT